MNKKRKDTKEIVDFYNQQVRREREYFNRRIVNMKCDICNKKINDQDVFGSGNEILCEECCENKIKEIENKSAK